MKVQDLSVVIGSNMTLKRSKSPKQMLTSMLVNRTGIRITKMIHRMYDIGGNRIS